MISVNDSGQGLIYDLTAPRTVQAFIVVLFSVVTCVMILRGQPPSELLSGVLFAVIGYYFGEITNRKGVEVNGQSAARIADQVVKQTIFHLERVAPVVQAAAQPVGESAPVPVVGDSGTPVHTSGIK